MYRFKASKYKNAAPKVPKKGEGWIMDIHSGSPQSFGNNIKASAAFMAFCTENRGGGSLGILALNDSGRKSQSLPLLHAHAEQITDFDFSPFDDGILATGSQDKYVKLWRISGEELKVDLPSNTETTLTPFETRVENVLFHTAVDSILAITSGKTVKLWDICSNSQIVGHNEHQDLLQSISWKLDGSLLVSSARDKMVKIWDPRSNKISQETKGHSNNRDSRVLWLGDSPLILSTGFGPSREREVAFRDSRKFENPVSVISGETSLGVLIPLFDPDTKMLFLAAKADTTLSYWEVLDNEPYYSEATKYMGDTQVRGIALVPKRAMEVMQGEVNRVLLLGPDCVVPVKYQVPRKTYRDFHADLFPDTRSYKPSMTVQEWQNGENKQVSKMSLDPRKKPAKGLLNFDYKLGSPIENITESKKEEIHTKPEVNIPVSVSQQPNSNIPAPDDINESVKLQLRPKPVLAPKPSLSPKSMHLSNGVQKPAAAADLLPENAQDRPAPRRSRFIVRTTKFRHLSGTIAHKDQHITNLCKLSKSIPSESDGFQANMDRLAVPLAGEGGHIAILELSHRGRLKSGVVPSVICGTSVMDFAWDPFCTFRLATACDDGQILLWRIPEGGLTDSLTEPEQRLKGHTEKVQILKFHPTAENILASSAFDLSIRIWDLVTATQVNHLTGHTDQIFSLSWSPDGNYLATVARDQMLRIFEPRKSQEAIREGPGSQGTRGARVVWVLGGTHLVISGFSRVSERLLSLHNAEDLSDPIGTEGIDVSPAILMAYYDEDSSTLFLTGKGDSTIFAFEVATDPPFFHPLSHFKGSGLHQAISFLPKIACDIPGVEFAKCFRLLASTIEPLSFTVPRLKKEYFQDDIFPPTRMTWEPTLTSTEWLQGSQKLPKRINLQPQGMELVSGAPSIKPSSVLPPSSQLSSSHQQPETPIQFEGDMVLESSLAFLQDTKAKEERLVQALKGKLEYEGQSKLEQDKFEGVDPNEWDEEEGKD